MRLSLLLLQQHYYTRDNIVMYLRELLTKANSG